MPKESVVLEYGPGTMNSSSPVYSILTHVGHEDDCDIS